MSWLYGELDNDVKEFLEKHNQEKGWGTNVPDLIETLQEAKTVWKSEADDRRWWYEFDRVVKIDDKFICYPDATSTRDMSAIESGWLMHLGSVRFVKPVEKTIIVYE